MKLTIQSQILRDAINKVLSVVDKKNSRPILTNCLIKSQGQKLELIATDLEVSAKILLNAQIEQEGSFCINSKNIADILRELPNDDVIMSVDNNNLLNLTCKNINYSLLVTSTEEFPQLSFQNSSSEFRLKTKQIAQIINKTSHAISTDETRLYLNGIYLQMTDSKLRAVAIDGHRLALLDTHEFIGENKFLVDGVIVPRKGISELKKIADTYPEDDVSISLDDSFMFVNARNEYYLSIRLIAREYPKYQTVIPSKTTNRFHIDRNAILNAVKRIKILSNEKTNGVKLNIQKNEIVISTNHPALGQATETLPITYDGKATEIGFNAKYLIESLSVLNETDVTFEFNNELSPVVIKADDLPEFLGIIMPLKL
ncbi:DNA polymerase III subunit beta [Peredibacter starrii]|uniref:Beta sliding clamp n=1 Tax=Peredibacter starrii TaxID=28202 RepID=A0AAX4HQM0_9BACT|nr:DNA polymerase III subunit beta [Peredibacter starrii]WPU65401.1 DNA polymerase III subunit beta [Peredibacter starrii]